MNEIVSLAKENELQDYKLIYPNNKNLKVNFSDGYTSTKLKTSSEALGELKVFEALLNLNKLFITEFAYRNFMESAKNSNNVFSTRELKLKFLSINDEPLKYFNVQHFKIVNQKLEELEILYIKPIKEIYFNEESGSIIVVVDEAFCSMREKKDLKAKNKREKEKRAKEARENRLLKEVNDLLN